MAITDYNKLSILFKKFFGKTQTAANLEAGNETLSSNLQLSSKTIFGESITTPAPSLSLWENNGVVQYVEFTVEVIANSTNYAITDTKYGDLQPTARDHGYILKLPSNYQSLSSTYPFTKLGTGAFINNSVVNESAGALQLIPVSFHFGYEAQVLRSDNSLIPGSNPIDYYIDYYSGILFVQDYASSEIPSKVRAYIYIGKYANETGINNVSASTANQVAFYNTTTTVSGATNLYWNNNNVGIGTTNPGARLQVSGSQSSGYSLISGSTEVAALYGSTAGGDTGILQLKSGATVVAQFSAGNGINSYINQGFFGIGTTNPSTPLDVNGQTTIRGTRIYHSASGFQTEFGPGAGTGNLNFHGYYVPSGKAIAIQGNAGSAAIFLSGSNVGIAKSTPSAKLDVQGFTYYRGNAYTISSFSANSVLAPLNIVQSIDGTNPAISAGQNSAGIFSSLQLITSETVRATILNNGNVGIGTTTPGKGLHIYGTDSAVPPHLRLQNSTATFGNTWDIASGNGGNLFISRPSVVDAITINPSGVIGIRPAANVNGGSPGIVGVFNDNFSYNSKFLNHYGLGFHTPQQGEGLGAYLSGYYGIDFFTAGTNRISVNATGQVGIGTTQPNKNLEIFSSTVSSPGLRVISTGYSGISYPTVEVRQYNGNNSVGVNHPRCEFVYARGTSAAPAATTNGDQLGSIVWWAADSSTVLHASAQIRVDSDGTIGVSSVPSKMRFFTNSSERMCLAANGTVGIGITNPQYQLHVQSVASEIARFQNTGTNDAFIRVMESSLESVVLGSTYGIGFVGTATNNSFAIRTNNGDKITILSGGNVGIGVTNPTSKLQVVGGIRCTSGIIGNHAIDTDSVELSLYGSGDRNCFIDFHSHGGTTVDYSFRILRTPGVNGDAYLTNTGSGDIVLGTNCVVFSDNVLGAEFARFSQGGSSISFTGLKAGYPLEVLGYRSVNLGGYGYLNSAGSVGFAGAQTIAVTIKAEQRIAAVEFDAVSDIRMKEVVTSSLSFEELKNKYKQINIVDFKMKDIIPDNPRNGVLAQEIEGIFPNAVSKTTDFIPNIYLETNKIIKNNDIYTITISKKHELQLNDKVSLFYLNEETELEEIINVTNIVDDYTFSFVCDKNLGEKIFLWGKEVDDFRTMNYQYLDNITTKMTQYLLNENEELKSKLEEKDAQIASILQRLAALENR